MKSFLCKIKYHLPKYKPVLWILGFFLIIHLFLRFTPYHSFTELKNQEYSTRFYDKENHLIQISSLEEGLRREWTDYSQIPDEVKKAFLTAEDHRYFFHGGVDFIAMANALYQNITSGRTVRGASTITMQLVKMTDQTGTRSFSQKIGDIFNAWRIEARFSKKKIFELYLNSIPFGQNCEGITSAARTFFGKNLSDLTLEEICCLAIIPRRPGDYNPIKNPEICAQRAAEVFNLPNEDTLAAAKNAHLYTYPFYMPHYIEYVKNTSKDKNGRLPPEIHCSANLHLQEISERYLKEAAMQAVNSRIANAALLLIDNKDNSPLAWIGNSSWFDTNNSGQIDGVLVKNQPGSSMKPFLYALALDTPNKDGNPLFTPSTILPDIPQEFGEEKIYIPENFNNRFNGPVRFRIALASSLNVPAVYILDQLGVDNYLNKLYELGFESLKQGGKEADLGLALGAGEVTLQELVTAFSVFTRDGATPDGKQLYTKDTARLICSILSDKNSRALGFGYTQTFQTDYPSIFKTGTSNQYQNITALGSTKDYTIGVWMGNFSGQTVMGKTGSSLPAWVAKNVLDYLENNSKSAAKGYEPFPEPEEWVKTKICPLSGMPAGENCTSSVFEYVKSSSLKNQKTCTWHKEEDGQKITVYPPEYQRWALQYNSQAKIDWYAAPLTITTPKNNSLFYYSSLHEKNQALPVELIGGSEEEALVYYDGELFTTITRPFTFHLPVEKGTHLCEIQCGTEKAAVTFEVK